MDAHRIILLVIITSACLFAVFGLMVWWSRYLARVNSALRSAEERYRELVDNMGSGVAVFAPCEGGRNFTLLSLNRAAEELERADEKRIRGRLLEDVFPHSDESDLLDACRRVWATGCPEFMPPTLYRRNGRESWRQAYIYRLPCEQLVIIYDDLTEKVKAVEALRDSRERMNLALTGADLGMWEWDLQGKAFTIDERWAARLGFDAQMVRSRNVLQRLVHSEDLPRLHAALNAHTDGDQEMFECEHRMHDRDGAWHWVLARGKVVDRATDGTPLRVAGTYLDCTARKQAEEALQRTVHFLQTFLNAIPDPVFYKDADGIYRGCNAVFAERILGLPPDRIIGRGIKELTSVVPPELAEIYIKRDHELLENPPLQVYDAPVMCADGVRREFIFRKSVFCDATGAPAGIVGVMSDITDRKETEAILHRRDAILDAMGNIAERFLRVTNWEEHVDDALARLGEATGVSRVYVFENGRMPDGAFVTRLRDEWTAPNTPPKSANELYRELHLDELDDGHWARALAGHQIVAGNLDSFSGDLRRLLSDEGVFALAAVPIFVNDEWWGVVGLDDCIHERAWSVAERDALTTVADIFGQAMARQRAERSMHDLQRRVQQTQKLESLAVMAGGIAHDFNNLLVSMLGYADLSLMEKNLDKRLRTNLQKIKAAAEQATALTNQMLAYSGHGRYATTRVDLNELLQSMRQLLDASVAKATHVVLACGEDLPLVEADPEGLRQVVVNLVVNASEAAAGQEHTVTVRTGRMRFTGDELNTVTCPPAAAFHEGVLLDVSDHGCGMDPATVQRIFDPFFSTKFTGRGLGLAAVLGIVRAHRGGLDVESAPGAGTRVRVILPITAVMAAHDAVSAGQSMEGVPDNATILVVDDEVGVRHVIQQALERHGYTVLSAPEGSTAVRMMHEHAADVGLVLLDLTMPGLSARDTLAALRSCNARVPVILMSGYSEARATSEFGATAIAGFMQKPFTAATLLDYIHKLAPAGRAHSEL